MKTRDYEVQGHGNGTWLRAHDPDHEHERRDMKPISSYDNPMLHTSLPNAPRGLRFPQPAASKPWPLPIHMATWSKGPDLFLPLLAALRLGASRGLRRREGNRVSSTEGQERSDQWHVSHLRSK